jgi:hypothetical protein
VAAVSAADELRRDIGRLSASRPDGMPTSVLAEALAAIGWRKVTAPDTAGEVSEMDQTKTPTRPAPQRCGSCGGVINPATSECRCSD